MAIDTRIAHPSQGSPELGGLTQPLFPGANGFTPKQLLNVLVARWKAIGLIFFGILAITAVLTILSPKVYEATTSVLLDFQNDDPVTGQRFAAYQANAYVATQIDLLKSRKVRLEVVDELGMADNPEARADFKASGADEGDSFRVWLADSLMDGLSVNEGKETRLVEVSYMSQDPTQAARIANAVVKAYREASLGLSVDPAQQRQSRYAAYLDQLKADVDEAQEKLTKAQQESGLLNVNDDRVADMRRLDDLTLRLNQAQSEFEDAQAKVRRIKDLRSRGQSLSAQADILQSNYVQELKGRLVQLESERAEQAENLGPNHPRMQSMSAEISTVRSRLNSEISAYIQSHEGEAQSAAERQAAIEQRLANERSEVLDVKRKRDEINQYVRELDSAKKIYQAALDRYDQILGGSELQQSGVSVLSWAERPREPSSPKPKLNMIMGLMAGLFFGCLWALVAELLDRRVRCDDDVTRELNLPLLGELKA